MKSILLAAIYATLSGGEIVHAPLTVVVDGFYCKTASLTEAEANAAGFKLVVDEPPACASNECAVAVGWEEVGSMEEEGGSGDEVGSMKEEGGSEELFRTSNFQLQPSTSFVRIVRTYEMRTITPPPRKFSKLKIYGAISSLAANDAGAWQRVKSWLEAKNVGGVNGWTAFVLAQEISEDHPLFNQLANEARELLGLSSDQFNALLDICVLEN